MYFMQSGASDLRLRLQPVPRLDWAELRAQHCRELCSDSRLACFHPLLHKFCAPAPASAAVLQFVALGFVLQARGGVDVSDCVWAPVGLVNFI